MHDPAGAGAWPIRPRPRPAERRAAPPATEDAASEVPATPLRRQTEDQPAVALIEDQRAAIAPARCASARRRTSSASAGGARAAARRGDPAGVHVRHRRQRRERAFRAWHSTTARASVGFRAGLQADLERDLRHAGALPRVVERRLRHRSGELAARIPRQNRGWRRAGGMPHPASATPWRAPARSATK